MLSLETLTSRKSIVDLQLFLNRASPMIFGCIMAVAWLHTYQILQITDGGGDLLHADLPKSLMLLHGQNPYSIDPWASPYPPFLLITLDGLLLLFNNLSVPSLPATVLSDQIRFAGLFATMGTGILVYVLLRRQGSSGITALVPAGLFVSLPAIGLSQIYFFHSDVFGWIILAFGLLAYIQEHYTTGTILLATATIFKIHPILALALILVWLVKTKGLRNATPSLLAATGILIPGLILPFAIPGYQQAVMGFNLSNTGSPGDSYFIPNMLYGLIPGRGLTLSLDLGNEIWIAATAALFTTFLGIVWTRGNKIGLVETIALGMLAWIIPMRRLLPHYAVWGLIPLLARRNPVQTVALVGFFETGDIVSQWSSLPGLTPIPGLDGGFGWFLAGVVFRAMGLAATVMILKQPNPTSQPLQMTASPVTSRS